MMWFGRLAWPKNQMWSCLTCFRKFVDTVVHKCERPKYVDKNWGF
jgi:hypothetical protein